jgi:hypothetical protein
MKTANMAIMSVAVLGFGLLGITSVSFSDVSETNSLSPTETGSILGHVTAIHKDPNGSIMSYSQSDNLVVTEGFENLSYVTFGALNVTSPIDDNMVFNVIALRDVDAGDPAAGDGYVSGDYSAVSGLAPAEVDGNTNGVTTNCPGGDAQLGTDGSGTMYLSCTFIAGGTDTIYGASILNNGSASHVFAAKNFTGPGASGITLNQDDQLTILWDLALANGP